MKFKLSVTLVVFAAALWTLQSAHVRTQSMSTAADLDEFQGRPAIAHEVLVRVRPGASLGPLHALIDAVDDRPIGSQGWHRIRSSSRLVQELMTRLAGRVEVLDVEPNYAVHITAVPNDPFFPNLWGMLNNSQPGADIHATAAWNVITGSTANVVGVVDTGVDYTHPDLAANMWSAPTAFTVKLAGGSGVTISCPAGSHGYNAITQSCDPKDDNIHGTHVSGTIGAVGNNGTGVAGVNWTTRIMGLKFLDSTGSGSTAAAVDAIDFAIQTKAYFAAHGGGANVRVLSNSWGGGGASNALSQEISAANNANMLFVAAAGNAGSNNDVTPFFPANYTQPNIIAVAATQPDDTLAGFSNYGSKTVHLGAPGTDIVSTVPGGGYQGLNGTSMATPHVSGAAMLILAACTLTTAQLKTAILNNVDALASLSGLLITGGRLNVDRAVRSCAVLPTVSLTSPLDGAMFVAPASIPLSAAASASNGISRVEFYQGTTLIGTSNTAPYGGTWSNVPAGTYTLTAKAYDTLGVANVSSSATVTVTNSNVPAPWASGDIGPVTPPGSATGNGSQFALQGAGADIWGTADGFRFVYQPLNGDGQIVARVVSLQNTNAWAKAGVMIREDLSVGARHASLFVTASSGVAFEWRPQAGGTTNYAGTSGAAPQWLKLTRTGNSISGYISANGSAWNLVTTTTVSTASAVYVGLAVTSHADGTLNSANFDNVAVTANNSNVAPTVAMTSPVDGAVALAPATIALGATASDSNGIDHVEFYQGSSLIGTSTNGQADGSVAYTATWSNVATGLYTLTAKAFDTLGASTVSGAVHITVDNPQGGIPAPWAAQDVGTVAPAGSTTGDGASFSVQGAGDDIWNGADAFRFVYQQLAGDGQIVARVAAVQNTNAWAKAGVMIREDLTAGSRHASLLVTPSNGVAFEWRTQPASTTNYVAAAGSAAVWLKLLRTGSSISAYTSANGSAWSLVATTTLNTANAVYVGLAVTSHANGTLCSVSFDNVGVSGSGGNAPPAVAMTSPIEGATAAAPATIALAATASDGDGIDHVEFYQGSALIGSSTNGQGNGSVPYTATWSNVADGLYTLTAKAFDILGATTVSGPVHITVNIGPSGVPAPWATQDVGSVTPTGNAFGDGTSFTVQGAGDDIWNGADAFRFVYQQLTGDGQIVARVSGIQNTNAWAKAGVMIREDLTAGARHASLLVSPTSGVAFEWRTQPGSATNYVAAAGSAPQWLKLVRSGTTFSAYLSIDGISWTPVGTRTFSAASTVYIGLAVTSHANGTLCNVTFDNVSF